MPTVRVVWRSEKIGVSFPQAEHQVSGREAGRVEEVCCSFGNSHDQSQQQLVAVAVVRGVRRAETKIGVSFPQAEHQVSGRAAGRVVDQEAQFQGNHMFAVAIVRGVRREPKNKSALAFPEQSNKFQDEAKKKNRR